MGFSKTIYSLVGVLVAVIMIATVAMPVITTASTPTEEIVKELNTEIQNPIFYSTDLDSDVVISYVSATKDLYVNGEFYINLTDISSRGVSLPVFVSDKYCIVYQYSNMNIWFGGNSSNISGSGDRTITISNLVSIYNCSWVAYIDPNGDYAATTVSSTIALDSLQGTYSCYVSAGSDTRKCCYIKDGVVGGNYTDYPYHLNYTQNGDMYHLSNIASLDSPSPQTTYVVLPAYTEVTIYNDAPYGPILNVVLLMLLIVPVTAVAAMLYTRRD